MSEHLQMANPSSHKANPYKSPHAMATDGASKPGSLFSGGFSNRIHLAVWLGLILYPVWLLSSFYITWLVAWIQLGHPPRPSLDDPKSIGILTDVFHFGSGVLLLLMPVLAPAGLMASFSFPVGKTRSTRVFFRLILALLYGLLCTLVIITLRTDPGNVIQWWFD